MTQQTALQDQMVKVEALNKAVTCLVRQAGHNKGSNVLDYPYVTGALGEYAT